MSDPIARVTLPFAAAVQPLPSPSDWSFELIERYHKEIARVAAAYGLDTYPNQIEVITSEQMMDAYASVGMPINYHHWSFGKHFLAIEKRYRRGHMGLAYEIVINTNPCIAYLMEENTMTMQALVVAHASYGHNSFFKGNYLFKQGIAADAIINELRANERRIAGYEECHGEDAVAEILDSCHALMSVGVDRYKRRGAHRSKNRRERDANAREEFLREHLNLLWRKTDEWTGKTAAQEEKKKKRFPPEPQENLLYFIEKNAPPHVPTWFREVIRIVRREAQYFWPQRQTQVMNEGWACFWHYTIIQTLYDEGLLSDAFMIEFLEHHTNVVYQPPYNSPFYSGINPYALGFALWMDLKRVCTGIETTGKNAGMPCTEEQRAEDREWFKDAGIVGCAEGTGNERKWLEVFDHAMRNFKDESFVAQYLSPRLMRDFRFFSVLDDVRYPKLLVDAIHDNEGYRSIREALSDQYNIAKITPDIQVWDVALRGDRTLTLRHFEDPARRDELTDAASETTRHAARLWGAPVALETVSEGGVREVYRISPPPRDE